MTNISWTLDTEGRLTATWQGNPVAKPAGPSTRRQPFLALVRSANLCRSGVKLK